MVFFVGNEAREGGGRKCEARLGRMVCQVELNLKLPCSPYQTARAGLYRLHRLHHIHYTSCTTGRLHINSDSGSARHGNTEPDCLVYLLNMTW